MSEFFLLMAILYGAPLVVALIAIADLAMGGGR